MFCCPLVHTTTIDLIIYTYTGIWVRDIKFKSNLVQTQVQKILKTLESKKLVKPVKSVQVSKCINAWRFKHVWACPCQLVCMDQKGKYTTMLLPDLFVVT